MDKNGCCKNRIMIAGTASGSGKTSIACGILSALKTMHMDPCSFKCGPDYIDPLFHQKVLGIPSWNLDPWFFPDDELAFIADHFSYGHDIAVLEGAMGYYDGIGFSDKSSSFEVAKRTKTPVVIVVDCSGIGNSAMAVLEGFLRFRDDSGIKGVIFNRMAPTLYKDAEKRILDRGLVPLGFIPLCEEARLESRHLGLLLPQESKNISKALLRMKQLVEENVDLERLISLANEADKLDAGLPCDIIYKHEESRKSPLVRIALADDPAFCFFYPQDARLLEYLNCEFVRFSPVSGESIPCDVDGIILPGGYPEVYAKELASNLSFFAGLKEAVGKGIPVIAECGGFMVMHEAIEGSDGTQYPMAGIIPGKCYNKGRLGRFGYVLLETSKDAMFSSDGAPLRAHEFHYWDSTETGNGYTVKKASGTASWSTGYVSETMYAGFPHIPLSANRNAAYSFIEACRRRKHI